MLKASIKNSKLKPAFIPFITAGYPDFESSIKVLKLFERMGACAVELGLPFSDPLADGPVLQKAAKQALDNGMNIDKAFELIEKATLSIPIILFSYANPLYHYGYEKIIKKAKNAGVSAFIVPDMPYEESNEFYNLCQKNKLDYIYLVAPTSSEARIKEISMRASGFIYVVSSVGVTGVRDSFSEKIKSLRKSIKNHTDIPVALGFGVSKKSHIEEAQANGFNAVIVASAIAKIIQDNDKNVIIEKIRDYITGELGF